jgi:hypothetical protein
MTGISRLLKDFEGVRVIISQCRHVERKQGDKDKVFDFHMSVLFKWLLNTS